MHGADLGGENDLADRLEQVVVAARSDTFLDVFVLAELTEEDDRDTPGMEILEQIAEGARESGKKDGESLRFELNRPKAIQLACRLAKKGDTILFLGKGNEKTIERADGAHAYYELDEIKKAVKMLKK